MYPILILSSFLYTIPLFLNKFTELFVSTHFFVEQTWACIPSINIFVEQTWACIPSIISMHATISKFEDQKIILETASIFCCSKNVVVRETVSSPYVLQLTGLRSEEIRKVREAICCCWRNVPEAISRSNNLWLSWKLCTTHAFKVSSLCMLLLASLRSGEVPENICCC